jgi:GTPase SAR1 family protein
MFDITDRSSFEDLRGWLSEIKKEIKDKLPKIIIANKIDLVESGLKKRAVTEKEMVDFCVEYNLSFKETSAKTGYNVRETFNEFAQSKVPSRQTSTTGRTSTSRKAGVARSTTGTVSPSKRKRRARATPPPAPSAADNLF